MSSKSSSGPAKAGTKAPAKDPPVLNPHEKASPGAASPLYESPVKGPFPTSSGSPHSEQPENIHDTLKSLNDLIKSYASRQDNTENVLKNLFFVVNELKTEKFDQSINSGMSEPVVPPTTDVSAAPTNSIENEEVAMHRGNVDLNKTPAAFDEKKSIPKTPGTLLSKLKAMPDTQAHVSRAPMDFVQDTKNINSLRHRKEFVCTPLNTTAKLPDIVAMKKAMIEHEERYGDEVKWKQVTDSALKMQLMTLLGGPKKRLQDFSKLNEETVYDLLIANARVKTTVEFTDVLKSLKPDTRLMEQRLSLHLWSSELSSLINAHIESFLELYDALMMNDVSLCPNTWAKTSNSGGGIDQDPLVSIFLNSFPHGIGKAIHRMLEIKRRGSFMEYIEDFQNGIDIHSVHADNVRPLQTFFVDVNKSKKGSDYVVDYASKRAKDSRLNSIEDERKPAAVNSDDAFDAQLCALTNTAPSYDKPVTKGCFHMLLKGQCPDGKNCKWDHSIAELDKTADVIIPQWEAKLANVKMRKYRKVGFKVNALSDESVPLSIASRSEKTFSHKESDDPIDDWSEYPMQDDYSS